MKKYTVAVLGKGAVGQELLKILAERQFPVGELRILATARSAGQQVEWQGDTYTVQEVSEAAFTGVDFAFFAGNTEASRVWGPVAATAGAVVIDKSNAWRMDPNVPLVVPEVNAAALDAHQGIIASPNCSTIQLVCVLQPLHAAVGLRRVVVSTYQAVSGTGREAMDELEAQTDAIANGQPVPREVYPHQIVQNVIPQCDSFDAESGFTLEELKLTNESRKIMDLPDLALTATAVRVPVLIGHSESVWVETERKLTRAEALALLAEAPGVTVIDQPEAQQYPLALTAAGQDDVFVGRLREDVANENALWFWCVSDNLRKGAATNAVQIAETLLERAAVKA